ncbi:MAG: hypothetical protein DMD82_01230 [Candidatus Rokuibacteriota bacterium]|nr:MAG: hypothetical protein DMD82_01230 [Candidatus Rokubacteria bacterium]
MGTVGNNACIRLIQTKINGGAYANDNLGPNATSGLTTNNVHIQNGANPNSFCVWDDRNPPGSIATARGKAAVEDAVQREPSAAVAK